MEHIGGVGMLFEQKSTRIPIVHYKQNCPVLQLKCAKDISVECVVCTVQPTRWWKAVFAFNSL